MSRIEELESALARHLGRRHCVAAGRGASALLLALKALPVTRGKVVVPDIACPSPASVPLYAGFEPLFCDVRLSDFNLCPEALARLMASHSDIAAIVPLHLYGQAAPMRELLEIAAEHRVAVIEDAAQALGGSYGGRMLGGWGEISIVSFGHTKTLDIGWGGAALTDDDELTERMREARRDLPARPPQVARMFDEFRKVYYALTGLAETNPALHELLLPLPHIYREMYLFQLDEADAARILEALPTLEARVSARRRHARAYRAGLQHPVLRHPTLDDYDAPWRYSFLVGKGMQREVTRQLRAAGIDASNWYPPLHRWYPSGRVQDERLFENSRRIANEVVNLWVTPDLPAGRIERSCEIVLNTLSAAGL